MITQQTTIAFLFSTSMLSFFTAAPRAMADVPTPPTYALPLEEMPDNAVWSDVQAEAQSEAGIGDNPATPQYNSNQVEEVYFDGDYTPDVNHTKLAVLSDDGCDVSIDGNVVWSSKGKPQAMPDLSNSLHPIPITLNPGQTYHIHIDYTNIIYCGSGDIDGVTLFAYSNPPVVNLDLSGVDSLTLNSGTTGSGPISATVTNAPQSTSTCQVTGVDWNWDFSNVEFSQDGVTNWGDPPGTSDYDMSITNYDQQNAEFNMNLDPGFWAVQLTAQVTYHTSQGDITVQAQDWVGQTYSTTTSSLPKQRLRHFCQPPLIVIEPLRRLKVGNGSGTVYLTRENDTSKVRGKGDTIYSYQVDMGNLGRVNPNPILMNDMLWNKFHPIYSTSPGWTLISGYRNYLGEVGSYPDVTYTWSPNESDDTWDLGELEAPMSSVVYNVSTGDIESGTPKGPSTQTVTYTATDKGNNHKATATYVLTYHDKWERERPNVVYNPLYPLKTLQSPVATSNTESKPKEFQYKLGMQVQAQAQMTLAGAVTPKIMNFLGVIPEGNISLSAQLQVSVNGQVSITMDGPSIMLQPNYAAYPIVYVRSLHQEFFVDQYDNHGLVSHDLQKTDGLPIPLPGGQAPVLLSWSKPFPVNIY